MKLELMPESWTPIADRELCWQDATTQLVVAWSDSLQCWAWRAFDLETGALLGSGTALTYIRAEEAALGVVPR